MMRARMIASVLGVVLVLAGRAAAVPQGGPVRFWSVSKVVQGGSTVPVTFGAQTEGVLTKLVDLGPVAFNFHGAPLFDRGEGDVFSSADGRHYSVGATAPLFNPFQANSPKGAVTHLDEYQAYEKRSGDASLRITISHALMEAIDANARVDESLCPPTVVRCWPIRSIVRFQARAYAESAGGDFFNVGGIAFIKGRHALWDHWVATSSDSQAPVWSSDNFIFDPDVDDSGTFSDARMTIDRAPTITVPVGSVRTGELFAVHVSLDAEAVNDRGKESAVQAFIQDPQGQGPGLLRTRGLIRRGKPKFKEPRIAPPKPARCPGGTPRNAGAIQLSASSFETSESAGDPLVLVTRTGGVRGNASVTLSTHGGSARSGSDFRAVSTTVRFGARDDSPRLVSIPIRQDHKTEKPENFTVSLSRARCGRIGARRNATITIVDDPQMAPTQGGPSPTFSIGGRVDGLLGSGLVLSNLGGELAISGNGSFAFPGASSGQPYEVVVRTQPHNPDQVCTVQNGVGHVPSGNVTNLVVHCAPPVAVAGLDPTFGSGGKVSTPVGGLGQGEAVVIQPSGGIVTTGWRTVGAGTDFTLTRHDSSGNLDTGFGSGGVATTDLGGARDQAFDAALLPDNGIVAVGQTDVLGILKTAFGVVRYLPDGTVNPSFGTGGIAVTPFAGKGAQANAVAVQPDGKIVVAGFAVSANGVGRDFALARYNADGTLDTSFGTGGEVITDFGALSADAVAGLAISSDGKIVAVGTAGEDIALARYLPNGNLDPTFGTSGVTTTNLGFSDVANGVALTSDGGIVVAGYTIGAKLNNDFLLVRYRADGTIDPGFGTLGVVKTDLGGDDFAQDLTVDAAGRIVVVGRATSSTILDMALARYKPDGTLDTSFASGGILTADFHGRGEFGEDVTLDAAGRIVAGGYTANGSDTEFALMRANP